ncbi:MAG: hypothetical protein ACHQT9_00935 [Candidatus Saccharimonadales bacterium]
MIKLTLTTGIPKTQKITAAIVILTIALVGTIILSNSHASSPYASVGADKGTLAGGAISQNCSGSTDGNCVTFQGVNTKCTSTYSSMSLQTVINNAKAGDTICLNTGNYSGGVVGAQFSSPVTITAAPGQSPTIAQLMFVGASNIYLNGLTLNGGLVGGSRTDSSQIATHIHFKNIRFTGGLLVYTPSNSSQDTLIQNSSFTNVGQASYEGRLSIVGNNNTASNGVVIDGNIFGNSSGTDTGASDGIDINVTYGTVIENNQFLNIVESACGAVHCDSIQPLGDSNTTITGNYFYNDSTDIAVFDGGTVNPTIINNVIISTGYPGEIYLAGDGGKATIVHNTIVGSVKFCYDSGGIQCNTDSKPNTGITLRDNIITQGITAIGSPSYTQNDYNLTSSGVSPNGIVGTPTFVGGTNPQTWAGFALSTSSLGHLKASDGKDMGATSFGP